MFGHVGPGSRMVVGVAQLAEHRVVVPVSWVRTPSPTPSFSRVVPAPPGAGRGAATRGRRDSRGGPRGPSRIEPIPHTMNRRAKIVCTLGPATHTPEAILALVRAGMDVARLNFSPRHARGPRRGLRDGAPRLGRIRARGRHPGGPAGTQDPARPLRRGPGDAGRGRDVHDHHRGRAAATPRARPPPTPRSARDVKRRRLAADRRRQRAAARRGHRRHARALHGDRGRHDLGPQGHQPARRARERARAQREGHGGPAVRAGAGRGLRRAVVRARGRRRARGARDHGRARARGCR